MSDSVKEEVWDLYDARGVKTGLVVSRSDRIPEGLYHPVVHVCVFNEKGEMLIQKRNADKALEPDKWDVSSGGGGICGEEIYESAERELKEELGIIADLSNTPPHVTLFFETGFDTYYIIKVDSHTFSPSIQKKEIQAVDWVTEDKILSMIESGSFASFKKSFISMLFELKETRGSLSYNV